MFCSNRKFWWMTNCLLNWFIQKDQWTEKRIMPRTKFLTELFRYTSRDIVLNTAILHFSCYLRCNDQIVDKTIPYISGNIIWKCWNSSLCIMDKLNCAESGFFVRSYWKIYSQKNEFLFAIGDFINMMVDYRFSTLYFPTLFVH